jgi:hypothetical protein
MVVWKMPTLFSVWRRTVVHSYSKKMLESGDKHTKNRSAKTNYHVLPFWILPDCKQRPDLIVYNTADKKMCVMELTVRNFLCV